MVKMLDDAVTKTNIYSMQKSGVLINTTRKETETFKGLYLKMGLVQASYRPTASALIAKLGPATYKLLTT